MPAADRAKKGKDMLNMTRAKLHALVWSKPMTEIAKLYGVRDQHVAQACDAFEIVRPRAGHWQKVEHGKAMETVALDNSRFAPEEIIIIAPTVWRPGRLHKDDDDGMARRRAA